MIALLSEFLPYILAGVAALAGFLGVKRHFEGKGREKERERWNRMERERKDIEDALVDKAERARRAVERSDYNDLMQSDGFKRKE